ncbi:amidase [Phlyctema vagabunda]|uniref:Amidase n=1 Tax=Phlyctema vagabunda TaxID=108571 RepID=A0ABR4PS85_9HELO
MANFTSVPSLALPARFAAMEDRIEEDVPVGIMGMGEWGSENTPLRWGFHVEISSGEPLQRPPIWFDVVEAAKEYMEIDPFLDVFEESLIDI